MLESAQTHVVSEHGNMKKSVFGISMFGIGTTTRIGAQQGVKVFWQPRIKKFVTILKLGGKDITSKNTELLMNTKSYDVCLLECFT